MKKPIPAWLFNAVATAVYLAGLIVVALDVLVWRP